MTKGWRLESARHSLARRKIKTGTKVKHFLSKLGSTIKTNLAIYSYPDALLEQINDYSVSESNLNDIEDELDFAKHQKNIKKIVELQKEIKKEEKDKNKSEEGIRFFAKKYGYDANRILKSKRVML